MHAAQSDMVVPRMAVAFCYLGASTQRNRGRNDRIDPDKFVLHRGGADGAVPNKFVLHRGGFDGAVSNKLIFHQRATVVLVPDKFIIGRSGGFDNLSRSGQLTIARKGLMDGMGICVGYGTAIYRVKLKKGTIMGLLNHTLAY
ncbi:hypothetical protein N7504_002623 [Penicillium tannophilum]|nr:hypothetical protein N7504_002623 [Penicillium tannophilum]